VDPSTLDNITAYGSLATPVVLAVISAVFLFLRLRWEATRKREEDERATARQREEDERAAARQREEDERAAARQREEDERAAVRQREEDERAAARKQDDDARARAQRLEDEMRETRMDLAEKILMPFIDALNSSRQPNKRKGWRGARGRQPETPEIDIAEFRKVAFRLSLYGDDDVLKALNEFMQLAYSMEAGQHSDDPLLVLKPLGGLLLAIRRSAGNEDTSLGELEILEWMISDLRAITPKGHG